MQVRRALSEPFGVNVFVVREDDRAMVVDATSGLDWDVFAPRLGHLLSGAAVERVFLTHLHVDHVGGAARMAALTGAPLLMHEDEAFAVETGDALATGAALFDATMEAAPVTRLRTKDEVRLGARRFEVLSVPGHSPGHAALWEPESRSLFSGDVVFEGGSFGRVDLPGGDARELIRSLERLAALDPVNVYPGHMRAIEGGAREAILESLDNARLMLG
ncbi:MAG: hydroxyacylglutathione hydrolase [Thermoplasmata archaeon]|jgi:glyoxylase-like metal-dependent hydrolase (beta-lactamase superfamily II)|nr:hydroxyacylglutathione hydrolase [Thermoplasmata archaeon]